MKLLLKICVLVFIISLTSCRDTKEEEEAKANVEQIEAVEAEVEEISSDLEENANELEEALKELDSI